MPRNLVKAFFDTVRLEGISRALEKSVQHIRRDGLSATPELAFVVVEITTYCNLRCAGCLRTVKSREGHQVDRHMSVAEFRRVIDQLPSTGNLVVQGFGEPTLHPHLKELIAIARTSGKFSAIIFNSNGLARQPDYYRALCDAGLTEFDISVDALDQEIADRVRTGTDTRMLEKRLQQFSSLFEGKIGVRIVVRAENQDHISAMLNRLNDLGSFKVSVQPYWDFGYPAGALTVTQRQSLVTELERMKEQWTRLSITDLEGLLPPHEVCRLPWHSPAITVDGYVAPCCALMHKDIIHFGNIFQTAFSDIWQSEAISDFRATMEHQTPEVCRSCPRVVPR